ncbi:MAG: hypothetical protein J7J98_07080 [candidate division Zixibacteria bacterium]|nr:hypothetical protein [candidate division Zixibacteria bacterium]
MATFQIPDVHDFSGLLKRAQEKASDTKPRAALIVPSETKTLLAFLKATALGLIDPTIIGDEALLTTNAKTDNLDLGGVKVIDVNQPDVALATAAKMAEAGEINMLVQGRMDWDELVVRLSESESSFVARGHMLTHIGVLKPSEYPKLLMITDGLVNAQPDLKTKLGILGNLGKASDAFGLPNPRTAVVTAVEAIYPQMPATCDGAVLAKMSERGQIKGVVVDGPLSFDVAIDREAAESKGITNSSVAGEADAMLASSKQVAQGIYHAMSLYATCDTGGVLVGGRVPVAINSVTDSHDSRFHSICLAVLLS